MYFQLNVFEEDNSLGIVRVINVEECSKIPNGQDIGIDIEEEITESWDDFHVREEHELDNFNVDDFVTWHNENWVSQIERIFVTIIQP